MWALAAPVSLPRVSWLRAIGYPHWENRVSIKIKVSPNQDSIVGISFNLISFIISQGMKKSSYKTKQTLIMQVCSNDTMKTQDTIIQSKTSWQYPSVGLPNANWITIEWKYTASKPILLVLWASRVCVSNEFFLLNHFVKQELGPNIYFFISLFFYFITF